MHCIQRESKLSVHFTELPSGRQALAAAPAHLATADAVLYVYDCTNRKTFDGLEALRALATAHARPEAHTACGLLLGTKSDLERERKGGLVTACAKPRSS